MKMTIKKLIHAGVALVALSSPVLAQATDLCLRHKGQVLGEPLTLDYRWPLDLDRPPELLERPADANDLFNQALAPFQPASDAPVDCVGGSIVGALNCAFEPVRRIGDQPLTPEEAEAAMNAESGAAANTGSVAVDPNNVAEAEAAATLPGQDDRDMDRYAYGKIKVVPVFGDGHPPSVRLAMVDTEVETDFNKLTPEAARRIHGDLKRMSAYMKTWSTTLGGEDVTDLAKGGPFISLEMEVLASQDTSPQSNMRVSGPIKLPASCSHLFRLKADAAEQATQLAEARKRLRRLQERHKAETDSERKRRLGIQMQIAQNKVNQIAGPLETLEKRIRAEEERQDTAAHEAEIAAIKADPKLAEAARIQRLKEAADKLRAVRQQEKQRAAAIQAYQDGLRDYDEKIKNAPDDATREGYEEAKARYQRLYDSWSEQSRSTLAGRYRDLKRTYDQNAQDGLGPTDVDATIADLQKMGVDPERHIEQSEEGMMERAARIAKSDQRTLGGSASRANDAYQKFRDTAMAFGEERQKVIMTPVDLANKIKDIADGKITAKQVLEDQIAFRERFGRYTKGAATGTVKGLVGLGELGMDALALEAERQEAQLEGVLSDALGTEVEIDYFGDRKTKSAANSFAKAGLAMEKFFGESDRRSGLNPNVTLEEAWEDPDKVGEMLQGAAKAFSDKTANASEKVAGAVATAGDRRLGKIVKGGEKELRAAIEGTGEVVGEFSDAGIAGIAALKGLKGLRKGENLVDGADALADGAKVANRVTDTAAESGKAVERGTDVAVVADKSADLKTLENIADGRTGDATVTTPGTTPGDATVTTPGTAPGEATVTTPGTAPGDPTITTPGTAPGSAVDNTGTFNDLAKAGEGTQPVPFNDAPGTRSAETLPPSTHGTRSAETVGPSEHGTRSAETVGPSESASEMGTRTTPSEGGTFAVGEDIANSTSPGGGTFNDGADVATHTTPGDGGTFGVGEDIGKGTFPGSGTFNDGADVATHSTPADSGTFNDGSLASDSSAPKSFNDGDLNAPTGPADPPVSVANGSPNSGALVPPERQFQISPELQAMLDETPPDISKAEAAQSSASPFVGDRRPTAAEMRPIAGKATTPDGQPAALPDREAAAGLDLEITRPDGTVEKIQVGDRLGGGTTSTVYKTRDGKQAVRVAEMTSKDRVPVGSQLDLSRKSRKGFEADHVGRKLLEEAEPKATYFRTAERTSKTGVTRIDGKDYFVATEELATDARTAFANPQNPKYDWQGAPTASPLDRLTMELAIRDLNAQGIAFTDHKLANLAVVKDPTSPTGRRVVFFDTGGMMPMKGADDAARASNARTVQRAFDAPKSPDPEAPHSQRFNAYDDAKFWDRVDKRPFGKTNPAGAATPGGNSRRSEYFKLSEMNASELRNYIRNSPEMRTQLGNEGLSLDKLVIPGA